MIKINNVLYINFAKEYDAVLMLFSLKVFIGNRNIIVTKSKYQAIVKSCCCAGWVIIDQYLPFS